jgi:phage-related protein
MSNRPLRFIKVPLLLAGTALLCLSVPTRGQSTPNQSNGGVREGDTRPKGVLAFDQFLDSHPDIAAQVRKKPQLLTNSEFLASHPELDTFLEDRPQLRAEISQNPAAFMQLEDRLDQADGRRDLRELDRFMDSHPDIAAQVRQKPWLVTNWDFVQSHPDLRTFLQNHPQLRAEMSQNPVAFMQDEKSFDQQESRRDQTEFDQFMNSHREIAEQVRKNPSLVNDRQFLTNHPELQKFLQQNPGIREELSRNPNVFSQEQRVDNREYADARDPQALDRDVAQFDRFLDSHREIAEQVRKDPSLLNNREFVQSHPALQTYLQNNPAVREQIRRDPDAFAKEDNRFDRAQDWRDRDATREHMADFGGFLGEHRDIANDVSRDPSVVKNQEYVENHPDLDQYLNAHPDVRDELWANPQSFIKGAQQTTGGGGTNMTGAGSGTTSSPTGGSATEPKK